MKIWRLSPCVLCAVALVPLAVAKTISDTISSDDPRDQERARKMGAVDYIQKPCKRSDLLDRIKKNIGRG